MNPRNIALAIVAVITTTVAITQFAIAPSNLAWTKTTDLPNTTPSDYSYDYRIVQNASPIECYHNWTVVADPGTQPNPPMDGAIFRDGVLMPGRGSLNSTDRFRCDPAANALWIRAGDQVWWKWDIPSQDWFPNNPSGAAVSYPIYIPINNVTCFDNGGPAGYDCLTAFAPIEAQIPATSGPTYFFLRAKYMDLSSPDAQYLLLGVLGAPGTVRLIPIVPS